MELNFKLNLTPELSTKIKEQLIIDTKFLSENNIIDYSMLFGIHKKGVKNLPQEKRNSSVNSYLLSSYSSFGPRSIENVQIKADIYFIFTFSSIEEWTQLMENTFIFSELLIF